MHRSSSLSFSSSLEGFSLDPWRKRDGESLTRKGRVFGEEKLGNTKMKKNDVQWLIKCPNIWPLRLSKASFTSTKSLECGES